VAPLACAMRVWVIDPSRLTRKILEVSLGRAGYEVRTFADPVEALQVLHTLTDGLPDAACIATRLPRMDGYKVIHGLHQSAKYGGIVLIGLLTQDDGCLGRLKIRLAGAKQYLVKPLRTDEVLSVLFTLLHDRFG
jgi:DNA-binding response OmpR family regulator